jgi:hypothetical protein
VRAAGYEPVPPRNAEDRNGPGAGFGVGPLSLLREVARLLDYAKGSVSDSAALAAVDVPLGDAWRDLFTELEAGLNEWGGDLAARLPAWAQRIAASALYAASEELWKVDAGKYLSASKPESREAARELLVALRHAVRTRDGGPLLQALERLRDGELPESEKLSSAFALARQLLGPEGVRVLQGVPQLGADVVEDLDNEPGGEELHGDGRPLFAWYRLKSGPRAGEVRPALVIETDAHYEVRDVRQPPVAALHVFFKPSDVPHESPRELEHVPYGSTQAPGTWIPAGDWQAE